MPINNISAAGQLRLFSTIGQVKHTAAQDASGSKEPKGKPGAKDPTSQASVEHKSGQSVLMNQHLRY